MIVAGGIFFSSALLAVGWLAAPFILNNPNEAGDLGHSFADADCRPSALLREIEAARRISSGGAGRAADRLVTNEAIARRHESGSTR